MLGVNPKELDQAHESQDPEDNNDVDIFKHWFKACWLTALQEKSPVIIIIINMNLLLWLMAAKCKSYYVIWNVGAVLRLVAALSFIAAASLLPNVAILLVVEVVHAKAVIQVEWKTAE